ncbi:chromosome segregation protein SMC [Anaerobacillus sp. MEB173]|uniref:chromosome segregation protein SMC n=1 Tax=Anaerobacillus sp. MEB173 TaxID=3383345 RepID=UPI003F9395F4
MFLKKLDVVGFKSFAERISIDFVPGVTAVVGPNGSGKSNITDAVRWVLGEQSAKSLRGAKMEDIIFAGSDSRKSLNVAEVTLTLDNQDQHLAIDYSEVSVTRRVYRSGESEFFINKQACRLKDIIDLFMDSGLGREAFSIIGQGKIEEILSSKSEERRSIFEEAAGVLKYKTRKIKAEKKLAETEENLVRVEDILHELEGQVEPLKIQASIANDYLQKKDELKNVEVSLLVHEISDLHATWEEQTKKVETLKDNQLKLSTLITSEEVKIEQYKTTIAELDGRIEQFQHELLTASEELEKKEGQKEVLKERKKNYTQHKRQYIETIGTLEARKDEYEKKLSVEKENFRQQREKLTKITEQLQLEMNLVNDLEQDLEEELDRLKSDYIEMLNEQASLKNEHRYLTEQIQQQQQKSKQLDENNASLIDSRELASRKKTEIEMKQLQVRKQLDQHVTTYRDFQTGLEKKQKDYQQKEANLYQAYQHLQQFRSRIEVLQEMQADFSGFFQGVKEVLKGRDKQLTGIEGAIAELITVPKDYEAAIETALGGAAQHIVVATEKDARQAIQFLKKHRFGRATFLPLTVIKGRNLSWQELSMLEKESAFVGIGSGLIHFDDRYKQVLLNLLGHVVITKNLQGANEIARKLQHRYRIVTLEGDVVNPGGSMTGGSIKKKTTPLLGRQRELETLIEKQQIMELQTEKLEKHVKLLKQEMKEHEQKLEQMRKTGEFLRLEEQQLKAQQREHEIEENNVNERLRLYDREKLSFESERHRLKDRLLQIENQLKKMSTEIKEIEEKVELLTEKKKNQQMSKEQVQSSITELKIQYATEDERYSRIKQEIERLTTESNEINQQLEKVQEEYILLENEMNSNSTGEESLEEIILKKRHEKDELLHSISRERQKRLTVHQQLDDMEREVKELKRNHKQIVDLFHVEEVKTNRLEVELENRLNQLRIDYELSYEAAKEKYPLTIDLKEAKMKVKLIKLAIAELGTVNLGAIEEYERVSERYHFLHEQKSDLQQAKATLDTVIIEMDEVMTKRFYDTFIQIKEHFQIVFKELFGGGRADLQLSNPENLLETGVDIVAQPPGKKLQYLALLSGGERALTAIALMFAILRVRPVPFCVLDEVEAALDEANVSRFANYLKEFSKETQFIVVTHRKGTMEGADVLYGVTMQESGVSKLVSVRLEETRELLTS